LILPLFVYLPLPTNVISTEGGAFAAAEERSLYFAFAFLPDGPSFTLGDSHYARIALPIPSKQLKISRLQKILSKNPTKPHVKPQSWIIQTKQTTSKLQRSYLQFSTIELEIKKAPVKPGAFTIKTHNSFRKTNLPVTHLE
jgi:hypothetical protein